MEYESNRKVKNQPVMVDFFMTSFVILANMNCYELIPTEYTKEERTNREDCLASIKNKRPEPKGSIVLQIVVIILCVFLSVLIYGTFNIDSIP